MEEKKWNPNPTGKGGFKDNPQNRNVSGMWNPKKSLSFQYRRFINMSLEEFKKWPKETPDEEKTIAESLAYTAVAKAKNELNYLKELTDRSEGKAPVSMTIDSGTGLFNADKIQIEVVKPKERKDSGANEEV